MKTALRCAFGLLGVVWASLVAGSAHAQAVAICSDPAGYGYYHHTPQVPKNESGFVKDKITGGLFTLQRLEGGKFDILYADGRKQIVSTRNDGGDVILLRRGIVDATFLVYYPGMTIELYTFYTDAGKVSRFDIMQSKGGDGLPIHKSSVMSGICSEVNLHLIN